jgi:hypothetical protein
MAVKNRELAPWGDQVKKILGCPSNLGWNRLGMLGLGLELEGAGIFRVDRQNGHQIQQRGPFWTQWKPRTPNQIARGVIFKQGCVSWNLLTQDIKLMYNKTAIKYRMTGYDLFMHEWLKSH